MELIIHLGEKSGAIGSFIPLISSLAGAIIGAAAVFYTVNKTGKTKLKELLVLTISEERIRWINVLRDGFVDFNKNIAMYRDIIGKNGKQITQEETQRYEHVRASIYRITLLLNPSEHYMEFLIIKINELDQVNTTLRGDHDMQPYINSQKEIADLQQIILKAEWARVKEESRTGKELTDEKVEEIYTEVAKRINIKLYEFVEDWIQIDKDLQEQVQDED